MPNRLEPRSETLTRLLDEAATDYVAKARAGEADGTMRPELSMRPEPAPEAAALLAVVNVEVVYDRVVLVLKGVSFDVRRGEIVALLGGNGAGKTTTLRAVSNLLAAERGRVTKGRIALADEPVAGLAPSEMIRRGCIQVMEGRHCFGHLTIEENLLTGAYTRRDGAAAIRADLEQVYAYFPRLRTRRTALAGYTSGGEQQMCAIGRALMSRPA